MCAATQSDVGANFRFIFFLFFQLHSVTPFEPDSSREYEVSLARIPSVGFIRVHRFFRSFVLIDRMRVVHGSLALRFGALFTKQRNASPPTPTTTLKTPTTRGRRRRCVASTSSSETAEEFCVHVDEKNVVVGSASRRETVSTRALGRGSFAVVLKRRPDGSGDDYKASSLADMSILVTRRSALKDVWPGALDVVTSGVCQARETGGYEETMSRELEEELGSDAAAGAMVVKLFEFPYEDKYMRVWGACFEVLLRDDAELAFEDGEVATGEFQPLDELAATLASDPGDFTPIGRYVLGSYLAFKDCGAMPPASWAERHVEPTSE